jgi:hypothetical protein
MLHEINQQVNASTGKHEIPRMLIAIVTPADAETRPTNAVNLRLLLVDVLRNAFR